MIKSENQAVGAAAARVTRKRETVHPESESEGEVSFDFSLKDVGIFLCGVVVVVALISMLSGKKTGRMA